MSQVNRKDPDLGATRELWFIPICWNVYIYMDRNTRFNSTHPVTPAHLAEGLLDAAQPLTRERKQSVFVILREEVACLWNQLVIHICEGDDQESSTWYSDLKRIIRRLGHCDGFACN